VNARMPVQKLVRDATTGCFIAPDGSWTADEAAAMNVQNPFDITRLRHQVGARKLELVIKFGDGSPPRSFFLT
jgi:hypothetical protein